MLDNFLYSFWNYKNQYIANNLLNKYLLTSFQDLSCLTNSNIFRLIMSLNVITLAFLEIICSIPISEQMFSHTNLYINHFIAIRSFAQSLVGP